MTLGSRPVKRRCRRWIKLIGNGERSATTPKRESSSTIPLPTCWANSRRPVSSSSILGAWMWGKTIPRHQQQRKEPLTEQANDGSIPKCLHVSATSCATTARLSRSNTNLTFPDPASGRTIPRTIPITPHIRSMAINIRLPASSPRTAHPSIRGRTERCCSSPSPKWHR